MTKLEKTLTQLQTRSTQHLEQWLSQFPHQEQALIQAMHYSLLLGGKRIRPFLVYATGQMFGCQLSELDTPAASIECLHAYSLIHDDLPAMDNDDLRRGHPTCHIKFDQATAILSGDALQSLAFSILSEGVIRPDAEPYRLKMIQQLSRAAGANGMCLGQSLDLQSENQSISLKELEAIHHNKTGALIKCAIKLGLLAAGEKGASFAPKLDLYADDIGLAFQVQDDIIDIISDSNTLGKPQGSDTILNKSTYPSLLGIDGAREKTKQLLNQALQALETIPYNTELLEDFAHYIVKREY